MVTEKGLKLIGTGSFSKVYKSSEDTVLIKSIDPVKDCMSKGFFPDSRWFPSVNFIGNSARGGYKYYEMKYYDQPRSLKRNLTPSSYNTYRILFNTGTARGDFEMLNLFGNLGDKYAEPAAHLLEAYDALNKYRPGSGVCFEISPRNVAVDDGQLILLDVFFYPDKMRESRIKNNRYLR